MREEREVISVKHILRGNREEFGVNGSEASGFEREENFERR
jgi:hypothetical protein